MADEKVEKLHKKKVKKITALEAMQIELNDAKKTILLTTAELYLTQKAVKSKEIEISKERMQRLQMEMNQKGQAAVSVKGKMDDLASEHKKFFMGLKKKYDIPEDEGFSWNEETLEINPQDEDE